MSGFSVQSTSKAEISIGYWIGIKEDFIKGRTYYEIV